MKIIGTGLSGLVGSRVGELLSAKYSFKNLGLEEGVDITQKDLVGKLITHSNAAWVFHFAAVTDVDLAEKERDLGEKSNTWKVNVLATDYIVNACKASQKKLLYVSTDFVFDGTEDIYLEDNLPNPQSWYAITKYEGEKRVSTLKDNAIVIRIAFPYRARFKGRLDFVSKIRQLLESGHEVVCPIDQLKTPTFIDDVAWAIDGLVNKNSSGIFNVVGSQSLSPFEAAQKIAQAFMLNTSLVKPTMFAHYYQGRAPRPFHAVLKNDKLSKLGVRMSTFDEGLIAVKKQLTTNN